MLILLSLLVLLPLSRGLSAPGKTTALARCRMLHSFRHVLSLESAVQRYDLLDEAAEDGDGDGLTGCLSGCMLHEFELSNHKPLGCSVEESLASEADGSRHVFVAEVRDGGNAVKAGLRRGDVIVQLSGTFDEVVDVAGLGIEKIRSLVAGRPKDSPLVIRVARGSDVMERHELSLVELCIVGDDAVSEDCITSIYAAETDVYLAGDSDMTACDDDDDTECMLDSMWSDWSDGLGENNDGVTNREKDKPVKEKKKKAVQPWSSRSSPSGTYVRDPKTGKLVNIDE